MKNMLKCYLFKATLLQNFCWASLVYIIFRIPTQILVFTPSTYALHQDTPPVYCRGNTCVLFALGNRCISCYAPPHTHTHNLCSMSKGSFRSIFNNRTLSGANTAGKSGPWSDGSEGVLSIHQNSSIIGISQSNCLMTYARHSLREGFTPLQKGGRYILQPNQLGCHTVIW